MQGFRQPAVPAALCVLLLSAAGATAQVSDDVVKIAVTNDQSSIYSAATGTGVNVAAQLAIDDFGGTVLGKKIELVSADNQNKPDIGVGIVRRWLDNEKVDVIVDGGSSAVGMAIQGVTREKNKLFLINGSGTTAIVNDNCSPIGFQWSWDTYGMAAGTATALAKAGNDSWFFITADYTAGHAIAQQAGDVAQKNGGKVLGEVRHPFNSPDFSSFLLQAQQSKAKVVALANFGGDTQTAIKQANEFGIAKGGQKLAALFLDVTDINSLGLDVAQNLVITVPFYWDRTDASRGYAKRFMEKAKNAPTFLQSGPYSAVTHYLKAVKEAGTDDTDKVAAKMRAMKINDATTENASIREDGRVMRDFYVFQVKTPAESKGPWDFLKQIGTVNATDAAMPLSASTCKLVKK